MIAEFKTGKHIRWNFNAGHICGTIMVIIKSGKTDHIVVHKGSVLYAVN